MSVLPIIAGGKMMAPGDLSLAMTGPTLPAAVTLTRASSGSYINSSGVVSQAATDAARFDYDPGTLAALGLLVEPAATNLLKYGGLLGNVANWLTGGGSTLGGTVTAPDGSSNGQTVNIATNTYIKQTVTGVVSGATGTISVWAKKSASGPVSGVRITTNNNLAWSTGTSTYYPLTTAWQRIVLTGVLETGNTSLIVAFGATLANNTSDGNCLGNVDLWGAQLEMTGAASSYIDTTTASVTRAADAPVLAVPGAHTTVKFTFDDASTQTFTVTAGLPYAIPTNLNRRWIKQIDVTA